MRHLDEQQIQRLVDGEMDPQSRAWAEAHLRECDPCRSSLRSTQATCRVIKSTRPELDGFRESGDFWACLSRELPRSRPPAWPWLGLLPPFLLGTLGTLASLLVWGVHTGLTLQQVGLIGPLGSKMMRRLANSMESPMMDEGLWRPLGMSGQEMGQNLMVLWENANQTTHSGFGLLLALLLSGLLFAVVAMIYIVWVLCWMAPVERQIAAARKRSGPSATKGGN